MDTKAAIDQAQNNLNLSIKNLDKNLEGIQASRATPGLLNSIVVDVYGNKTKLNHISNISVADSQTLLVQPWDKSNNKAIEQALKLSDLDLTVISDSGSIRVQVPIPTQQRRQQLSKAVEKLGEDAKISLRGVRHNSIDAVKKMEKDGVSEDLIKKTIEDIDKLTKDYNKKVDERIKDKISDLMKV